MKRIISPVTLTLILLVFAVPAMAQSVKEIIGEKTGQYIYSQARDENEVSAFDLASDELASRVEAYIGANKIKNYNRNWKEWIKRIVNEKYGLTRVFLYVSVDDLRKEAEKLTATKEEYVGASKAAGDISSDSVKAHVAVSDTVGKKMDMVDVIVPETLTEPDFNIMSGNEIDPVEQHRNAFPEGPVYDIIKRIIANGTDGDIMSELSRGKNMKVISMYGNTRTKYLDHAYVVTDDGGTVCVYSPKGSNGLRTDFRHGTMIAQPTGTMIYWFLKK